MKRIKLFALVIGVASTGLFASCDFGEEDEPQPQARTAEEPAVESDPFTTFEGTWRFSAVDVNGTLHSDTTALITTPGHQYRNTSPYCYFEFRDVNLSDSTVRFHDRGTQGGYNAVLMKLCDYEIDEDGNIWFTIKDISPQRNVPQFIFKILVNESTTETAVLELMDAFDGQSLNKMVYPPGVKPKTILEKQ